MDLQQIVYVIDEEEAPRDSLIFLMQNNGLTSRGFGSARAFLDQLNQDQRGCIITELRMPAMDGIALVQVLGEIGCIMPVIAITADATVPLAVQAMKAGVADFIEKPFKSETILEAVRLALDTARKHDILETQRAAIERRRETLTERENQVFFHAVEGLSNKEIAKDLGIRVRMVGICRANVMAKMQADSLSGLVRMYLINAEAHLQVR
jgi:two-component system response regulator FixJ